MINLRENSWSTNFLKEKNTLTDSSCRKRDKTQPDVYQTNAGQVSGNLVHGRPAVPWKAQILRKFSDNQKDLGQDLQESAAITAEDGQGARNVPKNSETRGHCQFTDPSVHGCKRGSCSAQQRRAND